MTTRCAWVENGDAIDIRYHDEEWGVAQHDDRVLFEFLLLEGAQAGLSWRTILRRREGYRKAFFGFDPKLVLSCNTEELMQDPGIIRNRLKIESAIQNARGFLKIQEQFGSFDSYLWQFVDGKPIKNSWKLHSEIPAETKESKELSKDLKARGFNFVGPTIMYAYMQAVGLVNDHLVTCFRHDL